VAVSLTAPAWVLNSHSATLVARPEKNSRTVSSRFPEIDSAGGRSSGIGGRAGPVAFQPVGSVFDSETMSLRRYGSSIDGA
jgi:hypothetical protein